MVLDPNWGTNLFRTYLAGRQSRQQEQDAADEHELRGLQRQQIQSGMARQQKKDAATEALASEVESGAFGAPPVAPPRPTKVAPDALTSGTPPGMKIAPSLKSRPGFRQAIGPAIEDAVVKKVADRPDFMALALGGGAPISPTFLAKLIRADETGTATQMIMKERERINSAPVEAFKLEQGYDKNLLEAEKTRHSMRDRDASRAETKRHHGILEADSKARREMEQKKFDDETSYGKVLREKVFPDAARGIVDGIGALGGTMLKWSTGSTAGQVADRRAASQAEVQKLRNEMDASRRTWKAGENEKDRTSRATMNKDRIRGALERAEGKWKSDQLIAEAGNRVKILIANAGQQGLSDRQLERERNDFVRQMVRDGEVSEDSAAAAFDSELDSAWVGEGSIQVPKRAAPPIIDPNAGNVVKTRKNATVDDIDAALARKGVKQ